MESRRSRSGRWARADAVNAPFTPATAGWVLGPARDRARFDKLLPKEMPFAALNRELGTVPVDDGFAQLRSRAGWAIPWMEDELRMSSPELWVGRILRDAYDAERLGCQGLIGMGKPRPSCAAGHGQCCH